MHFLHNMYNGVLSRVTIVDPEFIVMRFSTNPEIAPALTIANRAAYTLSEP